MITRALLLLQVCVCVCVCICVHVPKLQRGVELLCASFCYVMRNHIRIHFSAGQAWQLGTLSVVLSPSTCSSCPVLLFSLLLINRPLLLPPCRPPRAWQENVLCLSSSVCMCVFVHERNVCELVWAFIRVCVCSYLWSCLCTAGSQHTSTDSCKVKGCFLMQQLSNCFSTIAL